MSPQPLWVIEKPLMCCKVPGILEFRILLLPSRSPLRFFTNCGFLNMERMELLENGLNESKILGKIF
jgi:hypothetical protein